MKAWVPLRQPYSPGGHCRLLPRVCKVAPGTGGRSREPPVSRSWARADSRWMCASMWVGRGVSGAPSPLSAVPGPTGIRLEEKLAGFHRFHWSWGLAEASGHRAASLALSRGEGCRVRAPAAAEPLAAPSSSSHGLRLWTKPRLHRPPVHPQLPAYDPMVAPPRLFPQPLSLQGPQVTGQNLSRCPRQLLPSWTRGHPSAPAVTQPCAAWSVPPPGGRVSGERAAGRS